MRWWTPVTGNVSVCCAPAAPHSHGARDWPRYTHSFRLHSDAWRHEEMQSSSRRRTPEYELSICYTYSSPIGKMRTSPLLQLVLKVVAVKIRQFATRRLTIVKQHETANEFCFSKHVKVSCGAKSLTLQIFCGEPIYSNKIKLMLYFGLYYPPNDTRILIFYSKPTKNEGWPFNIQLIIEISNWHGRPGEKKSIEFRNYERFSFVWSPFETRTECISI